MTLRVVQAGLQTSIQGAPYRGMRDQAIPASGAADPLALALANRLVGKAPDALAIEITLSAAGFMAEADMHIALTGAARMLKINDTERPSHVRQEVRTGDRIEIAQPGAGARSYIALSRDIVIATAFGSGSTCFSGHFGGLDGGALKDGDVIETAEAVHDFGDAEMPAERIPQYENAFILRYTDGPEAAWVTGDSPLHMALWTASQRMDRMGIALDGTPLSLARADSLASSAVFPGTVQCPPSGQPFLLGVDGQTSGGYPRIAQVIRADRHLIGQIRPGASVQLVRVNAADAQKIFRQKMDFWREYITGFRLD